MKSRMENSVDSKYLISGRRVEDILSADICDLYFYLKYAGYYICKKSFLIRRCNIDQFILILTLEGEGKLHYKGNTYRLLPRTVMLIDGMEYHEYYATDDGWTFQYIHFNGAMSRQYYEYMEANIGPIFELKDKNFKELSDMLEELYRVIEVEAVYDYAFLSAKIYTLITSLISYQTYVASGKSLGSVQSAVNYIIENYQRPITTKDIADAVFLSRAYLSEMFTKRYGVPPHEFLTQYRISRVTDHLLNTTSSISEIAEQNGFNDVFTLSRVFKKKVGMPPSEYRRKYLDS